MTIALPKTPSFDLIGSRALVTGASSGIGLACATALARAGSHVTLVARRAEQLHALQTALTDEGLHAESLPLDITDLAALEHEMAVREPFDIVVNSAGLARHSPALQSQPDDFDTVFNLNVKAAYFLFQFAAKKLFEAGKPGSLIAISSQMAHVGGVDRAVYCASKHAVEGFTKSMAIEWGKANIRVNTVCPTFIKTDLTAATFNDPEKRAWIEQHIKLDRVGEVEDLMGAVVYLASNASAMVTGTSLKVDGGWTAE
ncbi:SDR family NAD(P)-dependent oxidoreductase [Enterovibrio coralii]|uniref:3-oxoacyl-ACP reductase n=1 Tax=Enterovibrio coralii TaxID=294935 RepID=A0A135IC88_9GAMM|nr:SDR family oxidoreductase [Enterovibrio coralii]KXF82998.1 3-oxoacyl-ACP reductase [Enterovibrio coralii]